MSQTLREVRIDVERLLLQYLAAGLAAIALYLAARTKDG